MKNAEDLKHIHIPTKQEFELQHNVLLNNDIQDDDLKAAYCWVNDLGYSEFAFFKQLVKCTQLTERTFSEQIFDWATSYNDTEIDRLIA